MNGDEYAHLDRRVTTVETKLDGLASGQRDIKQEMQRQEDREERRFKEMHARFDTIDKVHGEPVKVGLKSVGGMILAAATGIGVPIAAAYILAGAGA